MTIPTPPFSSSSCSSTSPDKPVGLYPHEPSSLLPLLRSHLPRSLPVLATVLENISRPSTSASAAQGLKDDEYGAVYATFPPGPLRSTEKEGIWGIIVQMAEEGQIHLRFYCSAETQIGLDESSPSPNSIELQRAQGFTNAVAQAIVAKWGRKVVLGAIDSRWNQAMRDVVESRELAECTVFLAPGDHEGTDPIGSVGGEDHIKTNDTEEQRDREENERLAGMGLRVDRAREEDVEMIKSTCDVPRPFGYYLSRCPHTTVIRQVAPPQTAVSWIIHHADGALGALYTLPEWRRRGLGEVVTRRRMRERKAFLESSSPVGGDTIRDFCYVFRGNKASEGLWTKLGWTEGWGVRWILNMEAEKERGKVEKYVVET